MIMEGAPRRATLADVAREAGVSIKTVSRVVNSVPTVDKELTARVLDVVQRLGYRRNDVAASLRTANVNTTIGLVIEDLSNAFYSTIAAAAAQEARRNNAQLITASSEESPEIERELTLNMCQRRVDGLLVVPAGNDHSYLQHEIELGTPVVFLDRPPSGLLADVVMLDNRAGARAAVQFLLDEGHRRIGIIVDSLKIFTMRERLDGAQAAMQAAGGSFDDRLLKIGPHDPAAAAEAALALLQLPDPPTAIFCGNNRITLGAIETAWRIGSGVRIAGFDDFELSHLVPSRVVLVRYDAAALGQHAARILFDRIKGDRSWPETHLLPTTLVERGIDPRQSRGSDAPRLPERVAPS